MAHPDSARQVEALRSVHFRTNPVLAIYEPDPGKEAGTPGMIRTTDVRIRSPVLSLHHEPMVKVTRECLRITKTLR